ncbi:nitrogen permease regulator 2 [Podospora australis]|uniref:Nitrogen permease regulator 2 n=1 Tax=Podospora australis TaxID=1536484 RepID=A0AAN7AMR5_9PEZI|nr:nitrogen permease regulator 2 [Podospora australis]
MIQGIFYARFFPQEGTKIVAQSPPGCIVPVPSSSSSSNTSVTKPPLFDFGVLSEYIIPRQAFCNRYITVTDPENKYFILGYPVSIPDEKYDRNEFIFNFGLVVEADVDQVPYERVVRRLAVTFSEMEKQSGYLSQSSPSPSDEYDHFRRPIESLLEIIKEDLNNYGECMIPVDEANTINMKLFPHHPVPPEVKGWHVPVAKMKFSEIVDPTWDLTLQKVIAQIDGVSDVRRIAYQADVSLELTQLALRHLLYYDTILLLDMFFFGACYAPRPGIHDFVANLGGMVDECANYVCIGNSLSTSSSSTPGEGSNSTNPTPDSPPMARRRDSSSSHLTGASATSLSPNAARRLPPGPGSLSPNLTRPLQPPSVTGNGSSYRVSNYMLIKLLTTFCVGKTVSEWLKGHLDSGFDVLRYIDVRRLVQFGVIKGCLYRVHKYIVSKQYLAALATGQARPSAGGDPLQKYTDGLHTFDQIITEQNLTESEIMEKLKGFKAPAGDLTVLYR